MNTSIQIQEPKKTLENWHALSKEVCMEKFASSVNGLTKEQVSQYLVTYGPNSLEQRTQQSILKRWLNQFNNILIYILFVATLVTGAMQHWVDSGVILIVVLLNAIIGFIQEGKAEKSLNALRKILSQKATVIRDGKVSRINASELVPGDIVKLNTGDKVPADMRLIEANSLEVDESMLTGESLPAEKNNSSLPENTLLSDRSSMAYSGTYVTFGNGQGIVVSTGSNTEVGRISNLLEQPNNLSTPLMKQLDDLGKSLAKIILAFSTFIFVFGIFIRHYPLSEMFMASVAIAVSVIPEGLPAIITITLAIGVTRMAKRNAIVRRLASVETLSSVTVICTDKTGTLTKNELTVTQLVTADSDATITTNEEQNKELISQHPDLVDLVKAGNICNDAALEYNSAESFELHGNPLDKALKALTLKLFTENQLKATRYLRLSTIGFNSEHKFMATLTNDSGDANQIIIKGAPEVILERSEKQYQQNEIKIIDRSYWENRINALASNGLRVIAIAKKDCQATANCLAMSDVETGFIFLGLIGIIDPPRPEVPSAVADCQSSGITVKMITGDHKITARAIAKQVGIESDSVVTGQEIDSMTDQELSESVQHSNIFVRTVPEHKIRIVQALKTLGHTVAMTGDGVNDAPALKQASIGIAMGIRGTDVAKEAAEIVLADDNFATIKDAVEEAKNVYNNLKKTLLFVLPNDGGEGFLIFFAILLGFTLPITPLQILWVNLVTAVTLALSLAFEGPEPNHLQMKPRPVKEDLLSKQVIWRVTFISFIYLVCMFGLFAYESHRNTSLPVIRTMVVNLIVLLESAYVINCRYLKQSTLNYRGIFGNKYIWYAIGTTIVLQLLFTYQEWMQFFFQSASLNLAQWRVLIVITVLCFFIIEIEKAITRRVQD